jgi:hypothetical protein
LARQDYAVNRILCYDWNGKEIKAYNLPLSINRFCADNNYIYGVKYEEDDTRVYRFALNEL